MITESNANIESAVVGLSEHNVLTLLVVFGFDDTSQQGLSARRLEAVDGGRFLRRVLEVVGVRSISEMAGRIVRVRMDSNKGGEIVAVGNVFRNNWFDPVGDY